MMAVRSKNRMPCTSGIETKPVGIHIDVEQETAVVA